MIDKLTNVEDQSRRNNLRINVIAESENETPMETENKIKDLVKNEVGI